VVPLIYDWIGNFSEGRASVKLNGKFGFVALDGNVVVPLMYNHVWDYQEGSAMIRIIWKYGFIDLDGNEVIPCWYERIQRQPYGFSACFHVSEHTIELLYFDRDGNLITEPANN
jgi:hypothetical protein